MGVPIQSPLGQASDEFRVLKERVITGNDTLWRAWEEIKKMAEDKERWAKNSENWAQAKEKLWGLVLDLRFRYNFWDCLYIDPETHKKTRRCLENEDGFFCLVCPCSTCNPFWEEELFGSKKDA